MSPLPDHVELPPETADTFAGNALGKARAAAEATGEVAIADDSGIESYALGGRPGIYSARFAGEDATDEENLEKLLREVPRDGDKRVAYVCALAYVTPARRRARGRGPLRGRAHARAARNGGFGYDPAFVPADRDDGRTMAELDPEEKDAISHRGRAARALRDGSTAARGRRDELTAHRRVTLGPAASSSRRRARPGSRAPRSSRSRRTPA